MKILLKLSFLLCFSHLYSQPNINYSCQFGASETPKAFVKNGNFYSILSNTYYNYQNSNYDDIRIVSLKSDGSLNFNKRVSSPYGFNWGYGYYNDHKLISNANGDIYGIAASDRHISFWQHFKGYHYFKLDTLGNIIFNKDFMVLESGGFGILSNTFLYLSKSNFILRVNDSTGDIVDTIFTDQSRIYAVETNLKKQISISSTNSLKLIDSVGNVLLSKPIFENFYKIVSYKKAYYGLNIPRNKVILLDSVYNSTDSIVGNTSYTLNDFDIKNDTLVLVGYDNATSKSFVNQYDLNLNNLTTNQFLVSSNNIKGVIKENSNYCFLNHENVISTSSSGISKFKTLTNLNYNPDIQVKRAILDSFNLTDSYLCSGASDKCAYFSYNTRVIVFNNSSDTVKSFKLNHNIYSIVPSASSATYAVYNKIYDSLVSNILIKPFDSLEVVLPKILGNASYPSSSSLLYDTLTINLKFWVSTPNNKNEGNLSNNAVTITHANIFTGINDIIKNPEIVTIYPNPAQATLNINYGSTKLNSVKIFDSKGSLVLKERVKSTSIDISNFEDGLYFIILESDSFSYKRKFVKEK